MMRFLMKNVSELYSCFFFFLQWCFKLFKLKRHLQYNKIFQTNAFYSLKNPQIVSVSTIYI